jgi:uncharacterized protein (TIGR02246 family)
VNIRAFAERYTAAWCSRNSASVAAFFSPNGSLTINDGPPAQGRAAIAEAVQSFVDAFPDLVVVMDDVAERDGKTLYSWTLTGTNTGAAGAGKRLCISGFEEWRFGYDGLIAESHGHFDAADYRRQLEP